MESLLVINNRNRIAWVDVAKGIGIILVMLGHMVDGHGLIGQWIWSFHMPLFFFLSGLFFMPFSDVKSVWKKSRQLLLPCIIFTIVICLVEYDVVGNKSTFIDLKKGLPHTMWFLTTLFLAMAWSSLMMRFFNPLGGLGISLFFAFMCKYTAMPNSYSLTSTFIASVFLIAGYNRRYIMVGVEKLVFLVILQPSLVWLMNIHTSLNINRISIVGIVTAFLGIIIVISVSKLIVDYKQYKHQSFIFDAMIYLGRNTLVLMSVHMLFLSLYIHFLSIPNVLIDKLVQVVFVFAMSILFSVLLKKPMAIIQGR